MVQKATAIADSNIAFVKYWGRSNDELRLPLNNSISMTLGGARTTTTVELLDDKSSMDSFVLNGTIPSEAASLRVTRHLDRLREIAGERRKARIESRNSFPTSAGIASSASGFAALTVATCNAFGLSLPQDELSRLARLGSGFACRSIYGGFVEWIAGRTHEQSYAYQIAPSNHWCLIDIVAVVVDQPKTVPSSVGHSMATSSPFLNARLSTLEASLSSARSAILTKDLQMLGVVLEAEAMSLHALMMTSKPSLLYWERGTIEVIHNVRQWRRDGIEAYFTIDAGPNVHVITSHDLANVVLDKLKSLPDVRDTIVCSPGEATRLVASHLF